MESIEDVNFFALFEKVVEELLEFYKGIKLYHAGLKKWIPVKVFLGLFCGDMPQCNEASGIQGPTSGHSCTYCHCSSAFFEKSLDQLVSPDTIIRCVPFTRTEYNTYINQKTKIAKEKIQKLTGINPKEKDNTYIYNPFWKLYDEYKFDIHAHCACDFFHISIIGLIKNHTLRLKKYVLNDNDLQKIYQTIKEYSQLGYSVPNLKYCKWWNGN